MPTDVYNMGTPAYADIARVSDADRSAIDYSLETWQQKIMAKFGKETLYFRSEEGLTEQLLVDGLKLQLRLQNVRAADLLAFYDKYLSGTTFAEDEQMINAFIADLCSQIGNTPFTTAAKLTGISILASCFGKTAASMIMDVIRAQIAQKQDSERCIQDLQGRAARQGAEIASLKAEVSRLLTQQTCLQQERSSLQQEQTKLRAELATVRQQKDTLLQQYHELQQHLLFSGAAANSDPHGYFKLLYLDPAVQTLPDDHFTLVLSAAFRACSKFYHPDRGGNGELMRKLNQANDALRRKRRA